MSAASTAWADGRTDGRTANGFGVSRFQLTGKKSYSRAPSLEEAKTAFKAEYVAWKSG